MPEVLVEVKKNKEQILVSSIMEAVFYFDVFKYPLTSDEIFEFSNVKTTSEEVKSALANLLTHGILKEKSGFYFYSGSDSNCVEERLNSEARALAISNKANRYAKFISGFPFVRSVSFSGSFSKGVIAKDGDVDYFIIVEPNRLWVCRTFLIAFKKIFLFNSKKFFCVNYFIDTENLDVPDKNRFVATEIATLKNAFGTHDFQNFLTRNNWAFEYFPQQKNISHLQASDCRKGRFKKSLEWLLSGKFGDKMDDVFLNFTIKKWKRKFPHLNNSEFELNMRSKKNVSKHHPQGFQTKVLEAVNERMKAIAYKTDMM